MKNGARRGAPDAMDRWPEKKLAKFQLQKIQRLLRHVYARLPFYRQRLQGAKVHPDKVKTLGDLARIPTFSKQDVLQEIKRQGRFDFGLETIAREEPAVLCMTSGTLGSSFLYLPRKWRALRGDSLLRAYWWAGLRPGMRMLMAAPAWHSLSVQESRLIERLGVSTVVPWGTFLPRNAGNFIDAIGGAKPDFVSIFLPMLFAILAECRRRGARPAEVFRSVKSILAVGAPMTPRSREQLVRELDVGDIFEGLGNPEGLTAMECASHGGHHIFVDCCFVEIIDPKTGVSLPAGQRGNVVITSLIPHGSIFLRYDTEDLGVILSGTCACGRSWPRMEVYDRRVNEVEIAGQRLVPYDVRVCLDELPELVNLPFAVVRGESKMERLTLLMQKPASGNLEEIRVRVANLLRKQLNVETTQEWAEELPQRWKGVTVIEEKDWRGARV
jgi:phenylacetate-CoA ligase